MTVRPEVFDFLHAEHLAHADQALLQWARTIAFDSALAQNRFMDFDMGAELFKALSDPGRLKVLHLLAHPPLDGCSPAGSVCACDLEEHLGLSQPTISHHMRLLVQAGLVSATKRGRWMDYTLNSEGFETVQDFLQALSRQVSATSASRSRQRGKPSVS